jgi:hypothetical protein
VAAASPHRGGIGVAGTPGARIGIARIDNDRRDQAAIVRQLAAVEFDGRGGELVLREHGAARDRLAVARREQRHVMPAFLNAGVEAGGDEPLGSGDTHG